jgi:dolichyl-phosphate-mannose-protein mannosyltransferase
VGFFIVLFIAFVYIAPLTYGTPGYVLSILSERILMYHDFRLDGDAVNSKRLLSSWTLHFAGKPFEQA